jgi:hypothetical protein
VRTRLVKDSVNVFMHFIHVCISVGYVDNFETGGL